MILKSLFFFLFTVKIYVHYLDLNCSICLKEYKITILENYKEHYLKIALKIVLKLDNENIQITFYKIYKMHSLMLLKNFMVYVDCLIR